MSRRIYRHDELLGMRMIANVAARVQHETGGYLVESNSDGFRCHHEFKVDIEPGKRRILLFGDSFVVGAGVRADQRFGDLLEDALDGVEVYNFGLTGSGTDQQYLAYHHIASRFDHDLVVFTPWVENIRRNPAQHRVWSDAWGNKAIENAAVVLQPKPYFEFDDQGELQLRNVPVPRPVPYDSVDEDERHTGSRQFDRLKWEIKTRAPWARDFLQKVSKIQPVPEYDSADDPAWVLMRAIIERWHAEVTKPMLMCPIPMYQHIEGNASPDGYKARFAELADPQAGLSFHDSLPDIHRVPAASRRALRFGRDIHFSESGHKAFAEALIPAVTAALAAQGNEQAVN